MATHSPQSRVVASRVNEIVGRLRERGHGLTPQRYAVVRTLVEGGEHPSAEQLFHRVSDAYPMMSRATVYKTLDTLNARGAGTYPIYKCSLTLLARHQDVVDMTQDRQETSHP